MSSMDDLSEADDLEAQHLTDLVTQADYEESVGGGKVVHIATFSEFERRFLNYETLQWIIISLLLVLAWGVGIILLLYTPIRRYVMRKDFRSRKLYVTSDEIVYKVTRPAFLPWFGVSKMEKCILLPLITDIVLEQGCLQSMFGLHSIRIETLGQGPLEPYSISICGVTNPRQFRKVLLIAATTARRGRALSTNAPPRDKSSVLSLPWLPSQDLYVSQSFHSPRSMGDTPKQILSPYYASGQDRGTSVSGEQILRKLEDINYHAKRIEVLVLRQQGQSSMAPSN